MMACGPPFSPLAFSGSSGSNLLRVYTDDAPGLKITLNEFCGSEERISESNSVVPSENQQTCEVEDNVNGAPTSLKKELRQGISYERWYSAYHYSRPPLVERCPPLGEPDKEKKIKETRPPLQQVATCPTLVFPCTLSKWISKKQNLILI